MTSDTDPLARAEQRIEALKVEGEKHLTAMIGEAHEDGPDGQCPHCDDIFGEAHLLCDLAQEIRRPLFLSGAVVLHSGQADVWKIDCDALTSGDWFTLAHLIILRVGRFSSVEGVPRGGLQLERELFPYVSNTGPVLIVDDVLTTGTSLETQRGSRDAIGAVVFARGPVPTWVTPLFVTGDQAEQEVRDLRAERDKVAWIALDRANQIAHLEAQTVALRELVPTFYADEGEDLCGGRMYRCRVCEKGWQTGGSFGSGAAASCALSRSRSRTSGRPHRPPDKRIKS